MLCTGCEQWWYSEDASPCPHCFPRVLTDAEAIEEIVLDFFAFQAAACTAQADCSCGRH
jgi:hypothetical protein